MRFSIELEEETLEQLEKLAAILRRSRKATAESVLRMALLPTTDERERRILASAGLIRTQRTPTKTEI